MKLSSEEKNIVDKVAAISGNSPNVVREVFYGLLIATLMEVYEEKKELHIPYLFKVEMNYSIKPGNKTMVLSENHNFKSNKTLREEIIRLYMNEKTEVEKHLEKLIENHISKILDFDVEETE